jgi:hypothetical protein
VIRTAALQQIDDRKPPSDRRLFLLPYRLFVCDSCFNFGLEQFARLADLPWEEQLDALDPDAEEALDAAYHVIEGRRVFCVKCVAELEGA